MTFPQHQQQNYSSEGLAQVRPSLVGGLEFAKIVNLAMLCNALIALQHSSSLRFGRGPRGPNCEGRGAKSAAKLGARCSSVATGHQQNGTSLDRV